MGPTCSPPTPPHSVGLAGLDLAVLFSLPEVSIGLVAVWLAVFVFAFTFQSKLELPSPPQSPEMPELEPREGESERAEDGACPPTFSAHPAGPGCPEGAPIHTPSPCLPYLWHPAVGLWAVGCGEPCRQGPDPSTPTQLGPEAVTTVLSGQQPLVLNSTWRWPE